MAVYAPSQPYTGAEEDQPHYYDGMDEPEPPLELYALRLASYDGQPVNLFVFDGPTRMELTLEEIKDAQKLWTERNPKGVYEIVQVR